MLKKRIISAVSAVLCLVLSVFTVGCEDEEKSGKLSVVTTIFPAYDFARAVFGDKADIILLLKPGTESHTYDPSAKDIVKIDKCDLFIYNGGESDEWVENILKSSDVSNTFRMTEYVEMLGEEPTADGHADDEYDEHIWTSPKNAAVITEKLGEKAGAVDGENREFYTKNAREYSERIIELEGMFSELLEGETRYFVFADRFPLLYFFKEYGLNYYAAFPGCAAETEPSAQQIAFLSRKLAEKNGVVNAVFCIELSNRRLAETLAADSGFPVEEFHSCHNITADDFEAGETWVSLMQRNYDILEKALKL